MPLHFFGFTITISRFGERFRDGQYSLVTFLRFFVLNVPVPNRLRSCEKVREGAEVRERRVDPETSH